MCGCDKNKKDKDKDKDKDKNVIVLTDKNFKDTMKEHRNILVQFYAPWCGFCKSLAPEYAKAANILAADGSSFKLAKIDSTVEKTLSKEFGIRGFPTMKYFVKGKLKSDYSGTRDAAGIVAWYNKKENKDKDKDKDKDVKEEKGKK
jgi:protein disulfide-isomerase A1